MSRHTLSFLSLVLGTMVFLYAPDAFAGDLAAKGMGLAMFLSNTLGPVIIILGIIGGGIAMALGIPGSVQRIIGTVAAGIFITSAASIATLIQSF